MKSRVFVVAATAVLVGASCASAWATSPAPIWNGVSTSATGARAPGGDSRTSTGTSTGTSTRYLITFDSGMSPPSFDETAPLRDQYVKLGVRFRGPTRTTGGAILNQKGNFGVHALTGKEFLAFNALTYARGPETMLFAALQKSVQLYVAEGHMLGGATTYTLTGWRGTTRVVRSIISTTERGWTRLSIQASGGVDRAVLSVQTTDGAYVVDNLSYTSLK